MPDLTVPGGWWTVAVSVRLWKEAAGFWGPSPARTSTWTWVPVELPVELISPDLLAGANRLTGHDEDSVLMGVGRYGAVTVVHERLNSP